MELANDLIIPAIVIGLGIVVVEWLRQKASLTEKVEELRAWLESQKLVQDEYNRKYAESVQIQRDGQAQTEKNFATYVSFNERSVALQESRLRVSQEHLEEVRRMNDLLSQLTEKLRDQRDDGG